MNFPSSLFPSIDITYIEDKYSGLSTEALLDAFNTFKANKVMSVPSSKDNETKVNPLYFDYIYSSGSRL